MYRFLFATHTQTLPNCPPQIYIDARAASTYRLHAVEIGFGLLDVAAALQLAGRLFVGNVGQRGDRFAHALQPPAEGVHLTAQQIGRIAANVGGNLGDHVAQFGHALAVRVQIVAANLCAIGDRRITVSLVHYTFFAVAETVDNKLCVCFIHKHAHVPTITTVSMVYYALRTFFVWNVWRVWAHAVRHSE